MTSNIPSLFTLSQYVVAQNYEGSAYRPGHAPTRPGPDGFSMDTDFPEALRRNIDFTLNFQYRINLLNLRCNDKGEPHSIAGTPSAKHESTELCTHIVLQHLKQEGPINIRDMYDGDDVGVGDAPDSSDLVFIILTWNYDIVRAFLRKFPDYRTESVQPIKAAIKTKNPEIVRAVLDRFDYHPDPHSDELVIEDAEATGNREILAMVREAFGNGGLRKTFSVKFEI